MKLILPYISSQREAIPSSENISKMTCLTAWDKKPIMCIGPAPSTLSHLMIWIELWRLIVNHYLTAMYVAGEVKSSWFTEEAYEWFIGNLLQRNGIHICYSLRTKSFFTLYQHGSSFISFLQWHVPHYGHDYHAGDTLCKWDFASIQPLSDKTIWSSNMNAFGGFSLTVLLASWQ